MSQGTLLGPLDGLTAEQINHRFNGIVAAAELGNLPALNDGDFSRLVCEMSGRPRMFTFVDLFCGAGGSSSGLTMAGGLLLFAANHSKRNIETHSANFRNADHECADLNHYDMRKLPYADVLWASPICTEISPAGGNKRQRKTGNNPGQLDLLYKEGHIPDDVFERTRATFHDVIRAAEVHRYPYVIVENVIEAAKDWVLFGWWLDGMVLLGYRYQIVCMSSAHVGDETNPHAPQRRDRMYVVFNRVDVPTPDVAPRPISHCDTCGTVAGFQWWKKPKGILTACGRYLFVGKYGKRFGQYVYRCPNTVCKHSIVTPYERPAASVIDWNDLGVRIGDRPADDPLVENTRRRIARGLQMFGRPTLVNSSHDDDRAYPADATPFPSRTVKIGDGIACPPGWESMVPAGAFIETKRSHVVPTSVWDPLTTITAGGNHHGLVVPYYTKGRATPTSDSLPTVTTRDRFGIVPEMHTDVDDCYHRMVRWYESRRAQGFPASYEITGNGGEKTAQVGNAVSRNVAQFLGQRCAAALNRTVAV